MSIVINFLLFLMVLGIGAEFYEEDRKGDKDVKQSEGRRSTENRQK